MDEEELTFCGTNIIKQFSDWLSGYDGLMSFTGLIAEGLFLLLVLKEFKMTKKSFEWTRKDRREEKTRKELSYFYWYIIRTYACEYKSHLDRYSLSKGSNVEIDLMLKGDKKMIQDIFEKTPLPMDFCQTMIKLLIEDLKQSVLLPCPSYNFLFSFPSYKCEDVYKWFIERSNVAVEENALTPIYINQRKTYFKSDDEIDEIYEKLTNIKL